MVKQWHKHVFLWVFILALLSGCWDELNIEERGFILGTAVDLEESEQESERYRVALTNEFVVPRGIGSPGEGPGDVDAYNNVTVQGESIANLTRKMTTMTSRKPFYGHLKVLIFSKELAEKENLIASIADLFLRNIEMRRSIKVVIADGKAKDVLDVNEITEKIPANFINMTLERNTKTLEVVEAARLGTLQSYLLDESSYALPLLKAEEGKLYTGGAAVFKGEENKLVGTLNKKEIEGYNLITEENKGGTIKVTVDDNLKVVGIDESKSSMNVDVDDPRHVKVNINIMVEGFLAEMFGSRSILKDERLDKIGDKVDEKVKKLVKETIKKAQNELHTDFLGIGTLIKQKHYDVWEEIRDNWEEGEKYFENATFDISVNTDVETTGATDRAKEKGRGE